MNMKTLCKLQEIFNADANISINVNNILGALNTDVKYNNQGIFCVNNILDDGLIPLLRRLKWTDDSINMFLQFAEQSCLEDFDIGVYPKTIQFMNQDGTLVKATLDFVKSSSILNNEHNVYTYIDFSMLDITTSSTTELYNFTVEDFMTLSILGTDINYLFKLYYPEFEISLLEHGVIIPLQKLNLIKLMNSLRRLNITIYSIEDMVNNMICKPNLYDGGYIFALDYITKNGYVKTANINVYREYRVDKSGLSQSYTVIDFSSFDY